MIQISKGQTDRILELGGGGNPNPLCDVNVDVRQCYDKDGKPTVHFTADFNETLPIQDNDFDGVFSHFAIEHISWRKIRQFLSESLRVIKPGGKAVFVTANTEAQMRYILSLDEWGEEASRVLFGDLDYPENSHKCAFSPKSLGKMLTEIGFENVIIHPYGAIQTDMAIEAYKPHAPQLGEPKREIELGECPDDVGTVTKDEQQELAAQLQAHAESLIKLTASLPEVVTTDTTKDIPAICGEILEGIESPIDMAKVVPLIGRNDLVEISRQISIPSRSRLFNMAYFDSGGVYGQGGYWDFPSHEMTKRAVLLRKPESVLELGCARGYVLKRLQDAGVDSVGLEVSKHCDMTRVTYHVTEHDICHTPWPIGGGRFDLCFSIDTLDRIPEDMIPVVAKEMQRTCKRGLHGIDFDAKPDGSDKTRCTVKTREWWRKILPEGHEIVHKNDLESGTPPESYFKGDGKLKLNIGSYITMFHHGWTNIDIHDLAGFAASCRFDYRRIDVRNGLPYSTGSVDLIFSSHFFEHLDYREGLAFLRDCRRVIKPDGLLRIVVPDANELTDLYRDGWDGHDLAEFDEINGDCAQQTTDAGKLHALLWGREHKAIYDSEALSETLQSAGWEPSVVGFRQSSCKQMLAETLDMLPCLSLYVEAKPKIG